ncbi:MAG: tubulin-like doman-containing protein [Gemmatimonadaceae bacterium]|jgi:hypothetical protein
MIRNYLIGIGGTGARVIESVLHLCAAGYGPESLSMFLIDPDQANSNLSRTKTLISQYQAAASAWHDKGSRQEARPFGTQIKTAQNSIWTVFANNDVTLSGFVNEKTLRQSNEEYAQLISVLFTEAELQTPLSRGFRGHPSIGSVVMSNAEAGKESSNKDMVPAQALEQLWQDIQDSNEGDARVFLVGSVFGGTGAAGVPTFGSPKMLKHHEKAKLDNGGSRVHLGGALVLPYFSFEADAEAVKKEKQDMYVTPADFPIATKAALEYYNEKELAFDELYFIGDSLGADHRVGKFGTGGKEQNNRPHYIELVTALAALDFWREASVRTSTRECFIAARNDQTVTWDMLPVTRDKGQLNALQVLLAHRIASMTTLGYVLNTYAADFLNRPHGAGENNVGWYKDHFKFDAKKSQDDGKDPRKGANFSSLNAVRSYTAEFVRWITDIGALPRVQLVDGTKLWADDEAMLPPLQHAGGIGGFLVGQARPAGSATFNEFLAQLNSVRITDQAMSASDRFLNLLQEASDAFCRQAYGLEPYARR